MNHLRSSLCDSFEVDKSSPKLMLLAVLKYELLVVIVMVVDFADLVFVVKANGFTGNVFRRLFFV